MRRGWDSNPRGFRLPLFESGTFNHSDTSPHSSLNFEPPVKRFHYAWVVVTVTFLAHLAAPAVRAAPSVISTSLESGFGWSRTAISLAISLSILTFGLGGPLGGTLIDRFGPRLVMLVGDLLIVGGLLGLLFVRDLWQLYLLWGIPIGLGTGAVGGVLGAAVAHRWFRTHRGVIIGAFGAATSAGQLVFVPVMAQLSVTEGWRWALGIVLVACAVMLVPVALFMRDRPAQAGTSAFGEAPVVTAAVRAEDLRTTSLREAARTRDFWLLAASFFVCGYTSNGLASLGTIYGWIFFSRMVGAAIAAFAGGFFRDLLGDYHLMFISAGILGFVAVSLALRISTSAVTQLRAPALEAARP